MTRTVVDIRGERFGKLIAVKVIGYCPTTKAAMWLCKCDCGLESKPTGTALRAGKIRSCGCDTGRKSKPKLLRYLSKIKYWGIAVRTRDKFTCQLCGVVQSEHQRVHAHHIKSKELHPELAFELSNGTTLCPSCHKLEHGR